MKSRLFFTTFVSANAALILYGIMALLNPNVLLDPFQAHVYRFPAEAVGATTYLAALYRLLGYFNVISGMLCLFLLHRYRTSRQEWHLQLVVGLTALTYLGPIVFDNTVGSIGFFEILEHILFALVLVTGFMMLRRQEVMA